MILGGCHIPSLLKMRLRNKPALLLKFLVREPVGIAGDDGAQDVLVAGRFSKDGLQVLHAGEDQRSIGLAQDVLQSIVDAMKISAQIRNVRIINADSMPVEPPGVGAADRQRVPLGLRCRSGGESFLPAAHRVTPHCEHARGCIPVGEPPFG